ncbi:MAG: hypothetical protein J5998_06260 [Clostridia bacterium]|nr:hypothetical protein [Clostridia bacterium]
MTCQDYRALLASPPAEARGFTRWWWYGCCVEKDEIERELDFMREAGLGGVELQILYPVQPDDPEKGFHNIPFGSPEFYDILAFTKAACDARGLKLDITPGSSWPYGGPFVGEEDAQQEALPYQYDITGPCDFSCDFTTRFAGSVCAAVLGRMAHSVMQPDTVIDITDRFQEKPLFGWPWGTELKTIRIPEGDWKIVFFVISMHHNHVGKPGRNAGGLVIDHCSRRAMDVFLENMAEPVARRVPGVNAWFCDSIEVEGHNWSGVLLEEFKKRRGYDLTPYIYALWGELGGLSPRVRYDYFKTMSELTIENFFDPLTEFAHRHGGLSRIQAHGTWGDILRVYAAADIPEGETFGDHRVLEVNTIHRRLAASAAHVYGRPLASNETFTWLKRPRFTETLEEMKAAVDAVFCDGMNMIVNHGYAYSPEKAGRRGWPFYASTHINHTTPWWPFYRHLADYIARVSAMLRRGRPCAEVAVYLPTADVYSDNMMSELHLAMRMEEHLGRARMDAVQKAGYWFDYINDEALTSLGDIRDGGLWIGENRYRAILLVGCARLPAETARALRRFAECGGLLIAGGHKPDDACGLINYDENRALVREAMAAAFACPSACVAADADGALIGALRERLQPDVTLSAPNEVGYVHRVDGNDHIYFLSNISDEARTVQALFKGRSEPCRALRAVPDAGGELSDFAFSRRDGESGAVIGLALAAHESAFVVFSPEFEPKESLRAPAYDRERATLTGWRLDIPERNVSFSMEEPASWETLPGLADFSGEGVYSCRFAPERRPLSATLRLERLSCACAVYVNGERAGDIWTHPYELDITKFLREGENALELRVASTLVNEMRAGDPEWPRFDTSIPDWPYYGKIINDQRKARLNTRREHEEQLEPLKSGVWGGVTLEYSR